MCKAVGLVALAALLCSCSPAQRDTVLGALARLCSPALRHYERGYAYSNKKDMERAIAEFTRAIEAKPGFALAYHGRGHAYSEKGDLDHAIEDYTRALELEPGNPDAYHGRGHAYARKHELGRAIEDYSKAIELDPALADSIGCDRGSARIEFGDWEYGIADLSKAVELRALVQGGPLEDGAEKQLAWVLATCPVDSLRDGKRALEYAQVARGGPHWSADWESVLAAAHAELGEFGEAVRWQKDALGGGPALALDFGDGPSPQPLAWGGAEAGQARLRLYESGKPYRQELRARSGALSPAPPAAE